MSDRETKLNVGAIVVATGFDPFDPSALTQYGYGTIPDVITALEYERLLSRTGPSGGLLKRPSDGEPVRRIAFLQCVGSRDMRHAPYCSRVCCRFATQEAVVAHRRDPDIRSTIFYADLRAASKGAQDIVHEATEHHHVRYVRARVAEVTSTDLGRPVVRYDDIDSGGAGSLDVDLVVLVAALVPRRGVVELSELLQVDLDEYGFVETDPFSPAVTSRPGVFVCGFCRGPADVTDSVAQASAAAAQAAEYVTAPQTVR